MSFWVLGAGAGGSSEESHSWHPHPQPQPHQHPHHHHHNQDTHNHPYDNYRGKPFQSPPFETEDHSYHHQHANRYSFDAHHRHSYTHADYTPKQAAPSIHIKNLAFLVIREEHPDGPPPETCDARSGPPNDGSFSKALPTQLPALERTASGLPIADSPAHDDDDGDDGDHGGCLLDDLDAAQLVRDHVASFQRRCPDSQSGRILRALINPKNERHRPSSRSRRPQDAGPTPTPASFPLDNDALRSVFSAANELFFANRLARRVAWDWSHPGSAQYQSAVVGTTALRRCAHLGGWETLIVLSSPVLRDTRYNRRLLLSTFLHEMIHSFLFVTCGRKAGRQGGHTEGFRQIAEVIDTWVGREHLRLSDMQADLQYFEDGTPVPATPCMGYRQMMGDVGGGVGQEQAVAPTTVPAWQLDNERNVWPHNTGGGGRGDATGHGMYLNEPVLPPPAQFRHPNDGAWQWYEREGFEARDGPVLGMHY